jgi:hypothetical protein
MLLNDLLRLQLLLLLLLRLLCRQPDWRGCCWR